MPSCTKPFHSIDFLADVGKMPVMGEAPMSFTMHQIGQSWSDDSTIFMASLQLEGGAPLVQQSNTIECISTQHLEAIR